MKLSKNQVEAIKILNTYPDEIIMHDGYLTGGHGARIPLGTLKGLKTKYIVADFGEDRDKLSGKGKRIAKELAEHNYDHTRYY